MMDDTDPTEARNRQRPAGLDGPSFPGAPVRSAIPVDTEVPPPPPPPPNRGVDPSHPDPDGELARMVRRASVNAATGPVRALADTGTGDGPDRPDERVAVAPATTWDDEPSVLGPRVIGVCAVALVVIALLCSQLLTLMGAGRPAVSIQDAFTGSSSGGLGDTDSGQGWESPTGGVFGEENGAAYIAEPNPKGPRTMTVVDLRSPHGSVQATVAHMAPGWGLVFRYAGPATYWTVTATEFASYNIQKVENGETVPVDNVKLARQQSGTVVQVRFQGSTIEVVIDGKVAKRINGGGGPMGTKVGLVTSERGADARWSEFAAEQLPSTPENQAPAPDPAARGGG